MAVRSVRLPDTLWHRLGEALVTANVGRRQPITLSTLIRGLIERGLLHSSGLDEIGTKIARPRRILEQTALEIKKAVVQAEQKAEATERTLMATSLFGQLQTHLKERALTYRSFYKSISSASEDPKELEDKKVKDEIFDCYNGFISDETAISSTALVALRKWIEQQNKGSK